MIVLKFGGTSVGNAERVRDAAAIIELQPSPRAAVVSAASGVTNLLLEAAASAAAGDEAAASDCVGKIRAKHAEVLGGISGEIERRRAGEVVESLHAALESA